VGQIRNVATPTTHVSYKLDDGTGSIEVKQFVDSDQTEPDESRAELVEGIYCRAWGNLKVFNGRKHVNAVIIRPVEDMNEVSYHLLEATAVHLYYTRGPIDQVVNDSKPTRAAGGDGQGDQYGNAVPQKIDLSPFSALARKVYMHIRDTPKANEGISHKQIAADLGVTPSAVATAGDELLGGGVIYSTLDDLTWDILQTD
jgi:replication factor A2